MGRERVAKVVGHDAAPLDTAQVVFLRERSPTVREDIEVERLAVGVPIHVVIEGRKLPTKERSTSASTMSCAAARIGR